MVFSRYFLVSLILFSGAFVSATAESSTPVVSTSSKLTREYVSPTRVVWSQGEVSSVENLLKTNSAQATFGQDGICTMNSTPESQASVLLDFGKEFHGGVQFVTSMFDGQEQIKVRIRLGESVTEAMSDINSDTGATNDHAIRDWEATLPWFGTREFGNSGFRFVRVDLLDVGRVLQLKEINAIKVYRDIPRRGAFCCNDPRLNQIWETGAYTVHQNMQTYIWDGIKRDRLVWIGDMHPEVMSVCNVFGYDDVVNRSLDLARDCAPLPQMMNGMSAYSLWWLRIHRALYLHQGDREYLENQREYMLGLIDVLISHIRENGRDDIADHFLDWPSRADENASAAGFHALFIMAMEDASFLMRELGEIDAAKRCDKALSRLRGAAPGLTKEFWAEGLPADAPGRKQAVALMCLADMITPEEASSALLKGGANGFSTFYGYYMLEALAKCGCYKQALRIASDFWGGMLDLGATTFWEDFDIKWLENAGRIDEIVPADKVDVHLTYGGYCYKRLRHSLAHGWASGPTSWMSSKIMGLFPLDAGSLVVRLEPHMAGLKWIEGSLPTPYGPVKVRLEQLEDGRVRAEVSAPEQVRIDAAPNVVFQRRQ